MSNWKYEKFKGQALLEKLKTISHLPHHERAKQCGYYKNVYIVNERRQQVELNISEFYDAIIEAKKQERQSQGKQNQPKPFDAVLGGEISPPVSGMVLGGIEGIKNRLNSTDVETRVAAKLLKNEQVFLLGNQYIKVWDISTAQKIHSFQAHSAPIRAMAISNDGYTVASGSADGVIHVWRF